MNKYCEDKEMKEKAKKKWVRLSVERDGKRGYKNGKFRMCGKVKKRGDRR